MKIILALLIACTLASCNVFKKNEAKGEFFTNWLGQKVNIQNPCLENRICTAERKENTKLNIHTEPSVYTTQDSHADTDVIVYEYSRKTDNNQALKDNFYREEIQMEIPRTDFKKVYKDKDLSKVKLVYGKRCYCKGEAGMYLIEKGTLEVKNTEKHTIVKLQFTAPVSSKIETINFVINKK